MYTNQDLVKAISDQVAILKFLWAKVTDSNKDFKFTDPQRTTEELMFYLVDSFPKQVAIFVEGKMNDGAFADSKEKQANFSYKNFASELDASMPVIAELINGVTEEQMEENVEVFGMSQARKHYLITYVLEFLWAYKTQLFLQLKASGSSELNTLSLRAGVDKM